MPIQRPASSQPLPPHAKRVFQGKMFDVYQWEQELFDGSTATFEKLKRPDTAEIIPVTADGRILLLEEEQPGKQPALAFPGGRVEPDEEVAAAVKRELLEETGYEAAELALWKAIQPVSKLEWAVYTFIGYDCRNIQEPAPDAGEKMRSFSVTFDEFLELAAAGRFYDAVTIEALRAKLDPQKMRDLKRLFRAS